MVRKIKDKNIAKKKKLLAKAQKIENRKISKIEKPKKRFKFDKVMLIIVIFSLLTLAAILFTNNIIKKNKIKNNTEKIEKTITTTDINTVTTGTKNIKVDKDGKIKKIETIVNKN